MKDKLQKIWKDSVFSKLIAEGLKWLWITWATPVVLFIWTFFKAIIAKIDFQTAWNQTVTITKEIANKTINLNILTLLLFVIGYFLLTFLIRRAISTTKMSKIKKYTTDRFWNAIIKWKWEKKDEQLRIKYDDFDLICPNSRHNLVHDQNAGNYFLRCNQCGFTSTAFHYEPPSNVVILAPMTDYYFYSALTSMVDAELRHKGLK